MKKYECSVCEWIYDPQNGDPDGGIRAGISYDELPDNWRCPIYGADKTEFEEVK